MAIGVERLSVSSNQSFSDSRDIADCGLKGFCCAGGSSWDPEPGEHLSEFIGGDGAAGAVKMLRSSCKFSAVKSSSAFATSAGANGVLEARVADEEKSGSSASGSGVVGRFGGNSRRSNSASASGDK